MATSFPADSSRLQDVAAVAFARPDVLVSADDGAASMLAELAATYYGFWNNGSTALFEATVSPGYIDRTLPAGRQQGPSGLADAGAAFFAAFPDGRVKVLQQMLVGDRIVSHLRVTGTFTGSRKGTEGAGQAIAYLATDITRVTDKLIIEIGTSRITRRCTSSSPSRHSLRRARVLGRLRLSQNSILFGKAAGVTTGRL